ncbi:TetR/AcrR family transcriptional regulator [Eubacteriales bacterium OttesenSCG-928-A19]|nr:TetR/AcrR family transcriptional regulator [Eubacteriales bacterium OttesenSCG-928-A19]
MKREEKNEQSRARIIRSALKEFSAQGYALSSINTICAEGSITKGVLYHYYDSKDALYLVCVRECFDSLTTYLQERVIAHGNASIQQYFDARLAFFEENPLYQRLFCEAVISPPVHLAKDIEAAKADFDALNITVLTNLLKVVRLRSDISLNQAIEVFRQFQDFVNARYQMAPNSTADLKAHEEFSSRALSVLLYGVVEREASSN